MRCGAWPRPGPGQSHGSDHTLPELQASAVTTCISIRNWQRTCCGAALHERLCVAAHGASEALEGLQHSPRCSLCTTLLNARVGDAGC